MASLTPAQGSSTTDPIALRISSLPYEIRQEIYTHLFTAPGTILTKGPLETSYGLEHEDHEIKKLLMLIDIVPCGPRIFYTRNTFFMSMITIPYFLTHTTAQYPTPVPEDCVTKLRILAKWVVEDWKGGTPPQWEVAKGIVNEDLVKWMDA
ncbi:MAG: hypothetical protein Q9169_007290 [Polycauliona sp. 2 TL-2023]